MESEAKACEMVRRVGERGGIDCAVGDGIAVITAVVAAEDAAWCRCSVGGMLPLRVGEGNAARWCGLCSAAVGDEIAAAAAVESADVRDTRSLTTCRREGKGTDENTPPPTCAEEGRGTVGGEEYTFMSRFQPCGGRQGAAVASYAAAAAASPSPPPACTHHDDSAFTSGGG